MAQALPHPIMYASAGQQLSSQYLPQYYPQPQPMSMSYAHYPSSYPERQKHERKRPKYTRSKTGCLTCRRKKVKCDETKPMCQRCHNSQLDCKWPEVAPSKKKVPPRKRASPVDHEIASGTRSDLETSPLPSVASELPQPFENHHQDLPLLKLSDPNLNALRIDSFSLGDRRHSEPRIHAPLAASSLSGRRHASVPDFSDGRFDVPPSSTCNVDDGASNGLGAMMNATGNMHSGSGTRSSTPNDFLYAQQAPQNYLPYSPSGGMRMLPAVNGAAMSSRPSTSSSFSVSQSLARRASSSSRPSTSSSLSSHNYLHRPASSSGGSDESILLGFGPNSFQMGVGTGRSREYDSSLDATTMSVAAPMQVISSAASRPSTANSASTSPYIRHVAHLSEPGTGAERWHPSNPSPLMRTSALAHSMSAQPIDGYYPPSMHSTPQHSRPQSPWGSC